MMTILVLIITFVAMFVQTITGFGYGSIAVPTCLAIYFGRKTVRKLNYQI